MTHDTDSDHPQQPEVAPEAQAPEQAQQPAPAVAPEQAQQPAPAVAPVYAPHPSHVQPAPDPFAAPAAQAAQAAPAYTQAPQPAPGAPQTFPAPVTPKPRSRAGAWVAGIAIGALLGGVVGGGVAAVVVANQPNLSFEGPQASGTLTLDNLDNATNVSAVAAVASPAVVTLEVSGNAAAGSGSGVIYSKDGFIVTNAHVVTLDGAAGDDPTVKVWLTDGRILDGTVVGVDPFADLAVVKVEATGLRPIELANSNNVHVGDLAVAIGAPLNLSNTVTSGVVSALNRGITVGSAIIPDDAEDDNQLSPNPEEGLPWFRFGDPNESEQQSPQSQQQPGLTVTLPVIQTDASINPGNSGGALLNSNAELIGINVAIASNASDASSAGSVGLGFAIPSNLVKRVADAIISGAQPSHGLLGVNISDSGSGEGEAQNIAGALIAEVAEGGAAQKAGLKAGDIIVAVNGIPTDSGTTASALVRMQEGGSEVTITYYRNGQKGEANVTLGTLDW